MNASHGASPDGRRLAMGSQKPPAVLCRVILVHRVVVLPPEAVQAAERVQLLVYHNCGTGEARCQAVY